jgi:hypothetical protein
MSAIDRAVAANQKFTVNYDPSQVSPRPRLKLAVLTCMDTRISYKSLGLEPGDAHMIRNAGGIVTDDALRSLLVSHYLLGTDEIMIVNQSCTQQLKPKPVYRRTAPCDFMRSVMWRRTSANKWTSCDRTAGFATNW